MHSVTSNAVAEALKYKDDWILGQVVLTDKFFEGHRLKNYYNAIQYPSANYAIFILPERPVNIINVWVGAVDGYGNFVQDGYYDSGVYTLRFAYFLNDNNILVTWTGWGSNGAPNLSSVTMFITYR